jgi:hypothetical protein
MIKLKDIKAAPKRTRPKKESTRAKLRRWTDEVVAEQGQPPIQWPKKGRPRIEDKGKSFEATKPWLAKGMSRRTWYARRKEERDQADAVAMATKRVDEYFRVNVACRANEAEGREEKRKEQGK